MLQSPRTIDTEFDPSFPDTADVARRTAVVFVLLTLSMAVLGGIGNLAVFDSSLGAAERDVVAWVADHRTGVLDTAATLGSTLTDTWTVIGVLGGSVAVLIAIGHTRCAGLMLIGVGLELAVFLVVGAVVDRSRPAVESLHSTPSTPSFPSGHVAAAVVLYGSLVLTLRLVARPGRFVRGLWVVPAWAAGTVAASRVYEGVHYPTDVVAGALLGAGALAGATLATGIPVRLGEQGPT